MYVWFLDLDPIIIIGSGLAELLRAVASLPKLNSLGQWRYQTLVIKYIVSLAQNISLANIFVKLMSKISNNFLYDKTVSLLAASTFSSHCGAPGLPWGAFPRLVFPWNSLQMF